MNPGCEARYHLASGIMKSRAINGEWGVCFLNTGESALKLRITWSHLSFLKGEYRIRDLWLKKDLGKTMQDFTAEIAPHDVILVKLSPVQ